MSNTRLMLQLKTTLVFTFIHMGAHGASASPLHSEGSWAQRHMEGSYFKPVHQGLFCRGPVLG
jgi:hypothetical protein